MTPADHRGKATFATTKAWGYFFWLTLVAMPLLFYRLGSPGLMDPDEGRYAEIAREMLALKDWLVPHLNFLPYLEKPPLAYWLTALSFQALGFSEFAARLPAALSALGGVFLTYFLGKAVWGGRTGFWAALILATCSGYVILGRLTILDMPLTFFLSLGLALGYLAYSRARRRLLVGAYLALGLAVLIKGPVALVLAGLIWGLWTLLDRRHSLTFWLHPGGLVLLGAIILPWFILVAAKHPEFPRYFLWEHHVKRFVAGSIHAKPLFYYGPVLLGLMLPWIWLLPWALLRVRPTAHPGRLFLLLWAGVIVAFFSFSGGKLAPYILPALVPLALLLGESLAGLRDQPDRKRSLGFTLSLAAWALTGTVLAILYFRPPESLSPKLAQAAVLGPSLTVFLVFLALTPAFALAWRRPAPLFLGAVLLCALLPGGMDRLSRVRSPRDMGLMVRSHWQPGAALVGVRLYSQSLSFYACQPFHLLEIPTELDFGRELRHNNGFYFSTPADMAAFAAARPKVFFFLKKKDYPELQEGLPGKFETLARWKDCLLVINTRK